jgi:hypothetical protein
MRTRSARALRDNRDAEFYEDDEISTVFVKRIDGLGATKRPQTQNSVTSSVIFGLFLVGAVYVGMLGLPQDGTRVEARGSAAHTSIPDVRKLLRPSSPVKITDDFKSGSSSWVARGSSGAGRKWSFKDGLARPGGFRIWKDSDGLSDYTVEFVGQIEKKAMSWAYRAKDDRNYYASKLLVSRPGPLPTIDLVRYAVLNGTEFNRIRLPLPMNVRSDTIYKVQMAVTGSDFSTRINGQMVDTWTDKRLGSGGIAFFSEPDEVAALRYVTLTDRDSVLGRLLSHFGLIQPAMLPMVR